MQKNLHTALRFDKVFPVALSSSGSPEILAIARNISTSGMFIEMAEPFPLGSEIWVFFTVHGTDSTISVRAEVKNHYAFHYCERGRIGCARGMGVRFVEFLHDPPPHLQPISNQLH